MELLCGKIFDGHSQHKFEESKMTVKLKDVIRELLLIVSTSRDWRN